MGWNIFWGGSISNAYTHLGQKCLGLIDILYLISRAIKNSKWIKIRKLLQKWFIPIMLPCMTCQENEWGLLDIYRDIKPVNSNTLLSWSKYWWGRGCLRREKKPRLVPHMTFFQKICCNLSNNNHSMY